MLPFRLFSFGHRAAALLLSAALLLTFAACDSGGGDDGGDPDINRGTFSVTISGDADETIEGTAVFGEATNPDDPDEEVFVIYLLDDGEQAGTYTWMGRLSDRPGPGTYAFANADEDFDGEDLPADRFLGYSAVVAQSQQVSSIFVSSGGDLEITSSSGSEVAGTFEIQATGFSTANPQEELTVTIEGTFNARSSNSLFLPFS